MHVQAVAHWHRCAHSKRRNRAGIHFSPASSLVIPRDSAKMKKIASATDTNCNKNEYAKAMEEASKYTDDLGNVLQGVLMSLG